MAKDSDQLAGSFGSENTGGVFSGLLAEEDVFDRRTLWRLGSWGVASVGAIVVALYANQSSIGWRHEQLAAVDLARQAQQIQSVAKESQNETRRLASAIDTLNSDRDRLYSRVTVLEQGLDSVTGAIARQAAASTPAAPAPTAAPDPQPVAQSPQPAPAVSVVATTVAAPAAEKPRADATAAPQAAPAVGQTASNAPAATPATPLVAAKSIMAPPDAAASKLIEAEKPASGTALPAKPEVAAAAPPADDTPSDAAEPSAKVAVQRTEFGVDVGGANSLNGLRALWRGLLKSRSNAALTSLRPIVVIKESSTGLGMQLRLVAGPLDDAAAAAKICARMIEKERPCETTVFDGQHLAMKAGEPTVSAFKPAAAAKPDAGKADTAKPASRRRSVTKRVVHDEPATKPDPPSTLSSLFGRR
jgi:hypothetical protein